jgi:hypothetical protein
VLDDVERGRFLVQPAGEHAAPGFVGPLDVDLDEGAGELLFLPWGGGFARAKAHDHVLPLRRLARVQRNLSHDSVALVEHSKDRNALRHRRDAALTCGGCGHVLRRWSSGVLLLGAASARSERERSQQRCGSAPHAYSGIHGS